MNRIIIFLFIMSFSLLAQTTDNTSKELEAARQKALVEEQKLTEKEAKAKEKAEKDAQKKLEKEEKSKIADAEKAKEDAEATKKGYNFFGRNAIGVNFAPTLQVGTFMRSFSSPYFSSMLGTITVDDKNGGFGMGLSYEHKLARYVTLAGDFNFANFGIALSYSDLDSKIVEGFNIDITELSKKAKIDLNFNTKAWAVGFRIYTKGNAPFGFFLYPRIGGTIVKFSGSYPQYNGGDFENIKSLDEIETKNFSTSKHGVYVALELGWRILLFPKASKNWPVQIALDISLIDLGYYLTPWNSGILGEINSVFTVNTDSYKTYLSIRAVPLPRLGFTIKF